MRNLLLILVAYLCTSEISYSSDGKEAFQIGSMPSQVMGTRITVSNLRKSLDYYAKIVGLREVQIPGVPRPAVDDVSAEGILAMNFTGTHADPMLTLWKQEDVQPTDQTTRGILLGFKVADIRAALSRAKAAGAIVKVDITEFSGALVAVIVDPDGYEIEMVEAPSVSARR